MMKDYYSRYNNSSVGKARTLKYRLSLNGRYAKYKQSAIKRSIKFSLSIDRFKLLTESRCYYCNRYSTNKRFCGIDRKNNNSGYTTSNSVSCCYECNFIKGSLNFKQFLSSIKRIYKNLYTKEGIRKYGKQQR